MKTNDKNRWNGRRLKKVAGGWQLEQVDPKQQASDRLPEEKTEEREVAETATAAPQSEPEEPRTKHLRLTDRDRQLMGILATVRYLSLAQLARLLFAERNPINLHKRLLALAGQGRHGLPQPYLKKLSYRSWEGMPQTAWALTPLGYAVAASVLPAPPRLPKAAVGANFIDHGLLLNELYVQLLELPLKAALAAAKGRAALETRPSRSFNKAKAGLYARAATSAFRWRSHDEVRLPWKDYEMKTGKNHERLIVPDATLEVPGPFVRRGRWGTQAYAGRRFFIEAETGSQTLVAMGDTKPGATLNKVRRYTGFFAGETGRGSERRTWYEAQYPDNFEPTVLFLVPTAARAASVNEVIAREIVKDGSRRHTQALAVTAADAVARLQIPVGGAAPGTTNTGAAVAALPSPRAPVTPAELYVLIRYSVDCTEVLREARRELMMAGVERPDYPASRAAFDKLVARLTTSEGTDDRPWL